MKVVVVVVGNTGKNNAEYVEQDIRSEFQNISIQC